MASHNNSDHHADEHFFNNHEEVETNLECPRCGKHSILHVGDQTYACLNCGFRRSLSNSSSGEFNVVVFIGIVLLLFALIA